MTNGNPKTLLPIPPPAEIFALRSAEMALPAYRFVPGLNKHPTRHPQGHSYGASHPTWVRPQNACEDAIFLHGCDLFDNRYFWEAHEVWEAIWHQLLRTDPLSHLVQGLIQCAASMLKTHVGHHRGSASLRSMAFAHFQEIIREEGDCFYGIRINTLVSRMEGNAKDGQWIQLPMV